jgi:hypothetical protein
MVWLGEVLGAVFSADTTRKVLVAALAGIPLFAGGSAACSRLADSAARQSDRQHRTNAAASSP